MGYVRISNLATGHIEYDSRGIYSQEPSHILDENQNKIESDPILETAQTVGGFNPLKDKDAEAHFKWLLKTLNDLQKEREHMDTLILKMEKQVDEGKRRLGNESI